MSLASADEARLLVAKGPILCVDTCSILDILRDPTRETFGANEAQAALTLIEAFKGNRAYCLMAEQVRTEFAEHVAQVERETDNALALLQRRLNHVHQLATILGATGSLDLSTLQGHAGRSRAVAEQMIACCIGLSTGDDIIARAFRRVSEPRTPARKGKDSMKDCVVIETYLQCVGQLRAAGHEAPIVFVSSNVTDYMENRRALIGDIASEFAALNLGFAPNLPAAKYLLGI
jgi:hypothetical protein